MKASTCIVDGQFRGGDIEPGTFHHWNPQFLSNLPDKPADRQPDASSCIPDVPADSSPTANEQESSNLPSSVDSVG